MRKIIFDLVVFSLVITGCSNPNEASKIMIDYIETEKTPVVEDHFGTEVTDNYRWLEDDQSSETAVWVKQQNEVTYNYLSKIPFREAVRKRLEEISDFDSYNYIRDEYRLSLPVKKNGKIYYFKKQGTQNHGILYAYDPNTEEEKVVINPNTFSKDGTTSISDLVFSPSGKYISYAISEGGSDWRKIFVINAETLEKIEKEIVDVKFTSITWLQEDGFFYSAYDKPKGSELSAMTDKHKLYYHKLGTPQSKDELIYGRENEKSRYVGAQIFENSDYLFMSAAQSTSGNQILIKKLNTPDSKFIPVIDNFDNDNTVIYADKEGFYMLTSINSPNRKIVKVNYSSPTPENWKDIVGEKEDPIESASYAGGYMFIQYLKDAVSKVQQYNLKGENIRELDLPGIGTVAGFVGDDDDNDVFFSYESFITPYSIYTLNADSGTSEVFRSPELKVDFSNLETKQVFYTSKDGTKVPMFIIAKKDIKLDGNNPTLLYGYGGFNISLSPYYSTYWSAWLDMGGVFALANLRGGGEYGDNWHKAGTKMQKQNVFDDFIAAAEYLQEKKYTSPEKLTIHGRSNGGLLIGAVETQRPELYKVALPGVGVLDMLRYHKFTAGAGWISDYGCADSSKAMFDYIYKYSPVHNVKENTKYPATLVTTGDHDDRVVPSHSFKFIAELQDKQAGQEPVLIRIETKGGHGAGKSTVMVLDEITDQFVFAYFNMGEEPDYCK